MIRPTIMTAAVALLLAGASVLAPEHAGAQSESDPSPEDVASPEAIVAAAYEAIARRPGENFNWQAGLYLPSARLIPNTEQTGGEFRVLSPEEFRQWVEAYYAEHAPIGGPDDKGFQEVQIHSVVERYGDIAHVMSTYQKHYWGSDEILGRGINSFQLVYKDGRWWIAGIIWDEENGAGPIPPEYLPSSGSSSSWSSFKESAQRFRSLLTDEDYAAARAMMAPDARRWWESREGEGETWAIGPAARGPWASWDEHFGSQGTEVEWAEGEGWSSVIVSETNDYYRLLERGAQLNKVTYHFDENGLIDGLVIGSTDERHMGLTTEFLAWTREHHPEEISELMPGGEIDPAADHPQRMRRLLNLWREATNREPVGSSANTTFDREPEPFPEAEQLLIADREFAQASATQGAEAWADNWDEAGVWYAGDALVVGPGEVRRGVASIVDRLRWMPVTSGMLWPDSLGFTVGRWWMLPETAGARVDTSRYLTVWRRVDEGWKVALDLSLPLMGEAEQVRDFDFWLGDWQLGQRIWSGKDDAFEPYEARSQVRAVEGGGALLESFEGEVRFFWAGMDEPRRIRGASVRVYEPTENQWRIFWIDTLERNFGPPFKGAFSAGSGEFLRVDPVGGAPPTRIRFLPLSETRVDWDLAIRPPEAAGWQSLWSIEFKRRLRTGGAGSR